MKENAITCYPFRNTRGESNAACVTVHLAFHVQVFITGGDPQEGQKEDGGKHWHFSLGKIGVFSKEFCEWVDCRALEEDSGNQYK